MVDEVSNFIDTVTPEDYQTIADAAKDYVSTLGDWDIHSEVRGAAERAIYSGDGDAVWRLKGLLNKAVNYGPVVKRETVMLLMNDPKKLRHFSPEFARGVVTRFNQNGHRNGHH
jgi:hypothetical protein